MQIVKWLFIVVNFLVASCATTVGDAIMIQRPFTDVGTEGAASQLEFSVNSAVDYEFYIGLRCIYPSCNRQKLIESLQPRDGNARLNQRYYGDKIIPIFLKMKVIKTDSKSAIELLNSEFSDVGQNMLDHEYIYIWINRLHFAPGKYHVIVTFTKHSAEISGFPAILLAQLPRRL